jgi:hypothetical protein
MSVTRPSGSPRASELRSPLLLPHPAIGGQAIINPRLKDYARTAIQEMSLAAVERRIYAHTGWRQIEGHWVYLHFGGAIGAHGPVGEISVRLSANMNLFDLRNDGHRDTLRESVKASLRWCDVGSEAVCLPLLAATCRAVLGDPDFALHLAGTTGAYKSELSALFQRVPGWTVCTCRRVRDVWETNVHSEFA